jgi:hypothetical protein
MTQTLETQLAKKDAEGEMSSPYLCRRPIAGNEHTARMGVVSLTLKEVVIRSLSRLRGRQRRIWRGLGI